MNKAQRQQYKDTGSSQVDEGNEFHLFQAHKKPTQGKQITQQQKRTHQIECFVVCKFWDPKSQH